MAPCHGLPAVCASPSPAVCVAPVSHGFGDPSFALLLPYGDADVVDCPDVCHGLAARTVFFHAVITAAADVMTATGPYTGTAIAHIQDTGTESDTFDTIPMKNGQLAQ